ncbi:anthranilate phosphoribosyltransferase [Amycolatopsis sp. CA-230715]|uniref:anthranilate phosphoribosyltransferase n=1 Tax=Amycolatopsis sp. CA-230715 TaxID=2745196 RepID=UPI001C0227DE|nr:hypothetical protein [Amycolatopsis sp. CA-230715]QWF84044.1 Anthranilate phosphoribosyltransferase [Amycolatopsis sp. CA-230715]
MTELLSRLLARTEPIGVPAWRAFWDRQAAGKLRRGEAAAVLASLGTAMPDRDTLRALFDSLDEHRSTPPVAFPDTVNIVGTGGGRGTFNISTASAFVAAATGVRVLKTGSRAYSGRVGSFDLLGLLGIELTGSYERTAELLDRHGIAFAGNFVYPAQITSLARDVAPLDIRSVGRFLNAVGPFLPTVPVSAQVTGVAVGQLAGYLGVLAERERHKRILLCHNESGVDELTTAGPNAVLGNDGRAPEVLDPGALGLVPASDADLAAAPETEAVERFLGVLAGDAPDGAVHTVCLNAAALAIAVGACDSWPEAVRAALTAVHDGSARRLVDRCRQPEVVGAHG